MNFCPNRKPEVYSPSLHTSLRVQPYGDCHTVTGCFFFSSPLFQVCKKQEKEDSFLHFFCSSGYTSELKVNCSKWFLKIGCLVPEIGLFYLLPGSVSGFTNGAPLAGRDRPVYSGVIKTRKYGRWERVAFTTDGRMPVVDVRGNRVSNGQPQHQELFTKSVYR